MSACFAVVNNDMVRDLYRNSRVVRVTSPKTHVVDLSDWAYG